MSKRGINEVRILGNLGSDPDLRYTGSGTPVVNLSIATSESWPDKESGETQERTDWHRASCFGKRAETIAEYFKKGQRIYIQGSNRQSVKEGEDGKKSYFAYVQVEDFQFVDSVSGNGANSQRNNTTDGNAPNLDNYPASDDIPF